MEGSKEDRRVAQPHALCWAETRASYRAGEQEPVPVQSGGKGIEWKIGQSLGYLLQEAESNLVSLSSRRDMGTLSLDIIMIP